MNKLNLDHDKIIEARKIAENITAPILRYVDYHSTVSIERTVLRLFGVQGYGVHLPLVNEVVDTVPKAKLARGIAYWFCLGLYHHPKLSVQDLAQAVAEKKIILTDLADASREKIEPIAKELAHQALKKIKDRAHKRSQLKHKFKSRALGPLKYIIIATGNIHEDVINAKASAEMGADIVAVIRSTAQSLLDFVPEGATTEGFGGTFATQKNFQLMREAMNESTHKLKRYIAVTNYSSGLCMPEIAAMAALEGLDYLLNDSMYGILFRDINMKRTFTDQYFSRQICAAADITIMTGEDNYLTTAESFHYWFQVLSSQLLNESFAKKAGMHDNQLALGHAFEMDPEFEDSIAHEIAQAQLVRELFPHSPIKFMPPTKHKTGDVFFANLYDGLFNLTAAMTGQSIQLLGMMTEAIHNPFLMDRFVGLKNANYIFKGASALTDEIEFKPNGKIMRRARQMLDQSISLLKKVEKLGLMQAIEQGLFAHMERSKEGGKGLEGVFQKDRNYYNPFFEKRRDVSHGKEEEDLKRLAQEEKEKKR